MVTLNNVRLDHMTSFGDAIFAFAITFMAISIQIPDLPSHLSESQIADRIFQLIPQFPIYLLSYFIIGIFWIKYHLIFNKIKDSPGIMLWLNLMFLFFITLISFGTALRLKNDEYVLTFVLYALILTITSLLLSLIWLHALRNNVLLDENMTSSQKKLYILQSITPAFIFASSIGISFIHLSTAQYVWILIIPAQIYFKKKLI